MIHVALWEPEIPPNTGNVARLCAATGARLHLIGRLGFRLDDRVPPHGYERVAHLVAVASGRARKNRVADDDQPVARGVGAEHLALHGRYEYQHITVSWLLQAAPSRPQRG